MEWMARGYSVHARPFGIAYIDRTSTYWPDRHGIPLCTGDFLMEMGACDVACCLEVPTFAPPSIQLDTTGPQLPPAHSSLPINSCAVQLRDFVTDRYFLAPSRNQA